MHSGTGPCTQGLDLYTQELDLCTQGLNLCTQGLQLAHQALLCIPVSLHSHQASRNNTSALTASVNCMTGAEVCKQQLCLSCLSLTPCSLCRAGSAVFNSNSRIMVAALKFFLGQDQAAEDESDDDDGEDFKAVQPSKAEVYKANSKVGGPPLPLLNLLTHVVPSEMGCLSACAGLSV